METPQETACLSCAESPRDADVWSLPKLRWKSWGFSCLWVTRAPIIPVNSWLTKADLGGINCLVCCQCPTWGEQTFLSPQEKANNTYFLPGNSASLVLRSAYKMHLQTTVWTHAGYSWDYVLKSGRFPPTLFSSRSLLFLLQVFRISRENLRLTWRFPHKHVLQLWLSDKESEVQLVRNWPSPALAL